MDPVGGIGGIMDILIVDGKVTMIGSKIVEDGAEILDASGLVVCAGLVDMHVHLRDPGQTHKEDMESGCRAAARGGFTSIAYMANTVPAIDTPAQIRYVAKQAEKAGLINVYPIAALTEGLRGEVLTDPAAMKRAGAVALSDDGRTLQNADLMRDALILARRHELSILSHCEDLDLVKNHAVNEGQVSRRLRIPGRPAIAETLMVMRDVMLAEETGGSVHICHVSTRGAVDIIRRAKQRGVSVTCETCPHYFTLTEDEILTRGTMAKVNPPLRTLDDVEAVIDGLRDGTIDVIATDHAPHSDGEKALSLDQAPSGISGLETALAVSLTALYHGNKLSLPALLRKMTYNPARLLRIPKGRLAVGTDGDVVLFDPKETWTVDPAEFASKGHNTPFAGMRLTGRVKGAVSRGKVIYWEGKPRVL